jgi:hypothetical protein
MEELRLQIRVDKEGMVSVEELEKKMVKVDRAVQASGKSASLWSKAFDLSVLTTGLNQGLALIGRLSPLLENGLQIARLQQSFEAAGASAEKMFAGFEAGARRLIDDDDLRRLAIAAQAWGGSMEEAAELANQGLKLAGNTGKDVTQIMDLLVKAINARQGRGLKAFGLDVDFKSAKTQGEALLVVLDALRKRLGSGEAGVQPGENAQRLKLWLNDVEDMAAGTVLAFAEVPVGIRDAVASLWEVDAAMAKWRQENSSIAVFFRELPALVEAGGNAALAALDQAGRAVQAKTLQEGDATLQHLAGNLRAAGVQAEGILAGVGDFGALMAAKFTAAFGQAIAPSQELTEVLEVMLGLLRDPTPAERIRELYDELANNGRALAAVNEMSDLLIEQYMKMGYTPEDAAARAEGEAAAAARRASAGGRRGGGSGGGKPAAAGMTPEDLAIRQALIAAQNDTDRLEAEHWDRLNGIRKQGVDVSKEIALEDFRYQKAQRQLEQTAETAHNAALGEQARERIALAQEVAAAEEEKANRLAAAADQYAVMTGQLTEYQAQWNAVMREDLSPEERTWRQLLLAQEEYQASLDRTGEALDRVGDAAAGALDQVRTWSGAFGEQNPVSQQAELLLAGLQKTAAGIGAIVSSSAKGGKELGAALAGTVSSLGGIFAGLTGNVRDAALLMAAWETASAFVSGIFGDALGATQHGVAAGVYLGVATLAGGRAKGTGKSGVAKALGSATPTATSGGGGTTWNVYMGSNNVYAEDGPALGLKLIKHINQAQYSGGKFAAGMGG